MAKFQPVLTNFTAGEFSPKLFGRVDLNKYYNGAAKLENVMLLPHGGAMNTPGTYFVSEVKDSTKKTRLFPFEFSTEQAYIIEAGDYYFRFYKDNGRIVISAEPPLDDYTKLLAHFDGDEGATSSTADTGQVFSFYGDTRIKASDKKFGAGCLDFPGVSNGYVTIPDSSNWSYGSADFTIDFWRKHRLNSGYEAFYSQGSDTSNYICFAWYSSYFYFYCTGIGTYYFSDPGFTLNTWDHIALVRHGNNLTVYKNGVALVTNAISGSVPDFTGPATIGSLNCSTYVYDYRMYGQIDEYRISKGIARWTSNFTPPTMPYDGADAWIPSHSYVVGDYAAVGSTIYYCLIAHSSGTFATDLAAGYWTLQTVYEVPTPYTADEVFDLQFAQEADIMYVVHPAHAPRKLSRSGHTSWSLEEVDFTYGPFRPDNTSSTTIAASATTGSITLTASTPIFDVEHIGALWKIGAKTGTPSLQGYVKITGFTSSTVVTATVKHDLSTTGAVTEWAEGSWSTYRGFPECVTFYEQRLAFANCDGEPQTCWLSKTFEYENFDEGAAADADGLVYTIASSQVNEIRFLSPGKMLALGTSGGVFILGSGTASEPLTPVNVSVHEETSYGVAALIPKKIGSFVYYVQRDTRKIRELSYAFDIDGWRALDMTILSDHVTAGGVVDIAFQQSPYCFLWCVTGNGEIATLTREIDHQVIGWTRQVTDGLYKSVATIPNGEEDQVWVIVERTINGATKRYVEYFKPFNLPDAQADAFFVHSGLTYSGAAATSISGLTHLVGETVAILADGAVQPQKVVDANGAITLDYAAAKVHVGLPYESTITTLRPEGGSQVGTAQGKVKRIVKVIPRFYRTLGAKTGRGSLFETILFRDSSMDMDSAPALYTGDKDVTFPAGYDTTGQVTLKQDQPLPFMVLSITLIMEVFDPL